MADLSKSARACCEGGIPRARVAAPARATVNSELLRNTPKLSETLRNNTMIIFFFATSHVPGYI